LKNCIQPVGSSLALSKNGFNLANSKYVILTRTPKLKPPMPGVSGAALFRKNI